MKWWDTKLVSLLEDILPIYPELMEEEVDIPCITYRKSTNRVVVEGDGIRYSLPIYQIKLYVKNLEDADYYLQAIDTRLYQNRFFRESFSELVVGSVHQYILNYSVSTRERIK